MKRNRKQAPHGGRKVKKTVPQYVGRVQMTREGYIFVMIDGQEDDV